MLNKKLTSLSAILFSLVFLLVFFSSAAGRADNAPNPLLAPGVDMQQPDPTATAAVPQPGSMPMGSMTGMSSGDCPMMASGMAGTGTGMSGDAMLSGSMAMPGMSDMSGMTGMSMQGTSGMSGMSDMSGMAMPGMSDMSGMTGMSMQGTSGMSGMSDMSGMTMQGMSGTSSMTVDQMNDLMGYSIYRTNPWWLLGWLVLFLILLGVIAAAMIVIYWIIRQIRRSQPVSTGS